jgi:hypothetical protein
MTRVVQKKWQGVLLHADKETTEVDVCLTSKAHSLLFGLSVLRCGKE